MIRFLFKSIFVLALLWTSLTQTARIIGSMKPLNAVVKGFNSGCENEPGPCWYGIVAAKTLSTDLEAIAGKNDLVMVRSNRLGFTDPTERCNMRYIGYEDSGGLQLLKGFNIAPYGCATFTLGDLI